jgi:hypothetical protein
LTVIWTGDHPPPLAFMRSTPDADPVRNQRDHQRAERVSRRGSSRPCGRKGCNNRSRDRDSDYCGSLCRWFDAELSRSAEILPQAKALGVSNTTEQWALLVEASDAWTRYLDARREMGRQLAERGERPPWAVLHRGIRRLLARPAHCLRWQSNACSKSPRCCADQALSAY